MEPVDLASLEAMAVEHELIAETYADKFITRQSDEENRSALVSARVERQLKARTIRMAIAEIKRARELLSDTSGSYAASRAGEGGGGE
jgi:hypothetical protein